jgi:SpoVK/Ycf46/Vps4 family AAA+-type ATPase
VFTLARKVAPCVIFLDEVDSLFAARGARNGYTAKREALNEFMMEWDGCVQKGGGVWGRGVHGPSR